MQVQKMDHGTFVRRETKFIYLVAAVLAVIVIGLLYAEVRKAQGEPKQDPFPHSPYDARLIALGKVALDDAYRAQITKLFSVWMGDEHDQPHRAQVGAGRARRAYIGVMKEIERRERQINDQR